MVEERVRYRPGPCQTSARVWGLCCCWAWEAEAFSWPKQAWPLLQRQTQPNLDHSQPNLDHWEHYPSLVVLVVTSGAFPWALRILRMREVAVDQRSGYPVAAADAHPFLYPSEPAWIVLVHYCCCCCRWVSEVVVPVWEDGMDPW
jgi:hypothetical protein